MARYRIDYHPDVETDLMKIASFIADYAGFDAADRKLSEIEQAMNGLAEFPHIGSLRNDIVPGLRAIPAADKAVICFLVDDPSRTVSIIAISYAGSNWQEAIERRT